MSFSTAGDMISLALKSSGVLGVGQTALAEDANDALNIWNMMIGQWNRRRWMIPNQANTYFQATGADSYTVGPTGNFAIARPAKITAAVARLFPGVGGVPGASSVDYPLEIIRSYEDWMTKISVKGIGTFPKYAFYDSAYPNGVIHFWPLPSTAYEMHILTTAPLQTMTALNTVISLPPEYEEAILYNLAVRLRALYQLPPDPVITALAEAAMQTIRNANTQIPRLRVPNDVAGRGRYNIYSDQG